MGYNSKTVSCVRDALTISGCIIFRNNLTKSEISAVIAKATDSLAKLYKHGELGAGVLPGNWLCGQFCFSFCARTQSENKA